MVTGSGINIMRRTFPVNHLKRPEKDGRKMSSVQKSLLAATQKEKHRFNTGGLPCGYIKAVATLRHEEASASSLYDSYDW